MAMLDVLQCRLFRAVACLKETSAAGVASMAMLDVHPFV